MQNSPYLDKHIRSMEEVLAELYSAYYIAAKQGDTKRCDWLQERIEFFLTEVLMHCDQHQWPEV